MTNKIKLFGIIMLLITLALPAYAQEVENDRRPPVIEAEVVSIISDETTSQDTSAGVYTIREQILKIKILEGDAKGELYEVKNNIDESMSYNLIIEEGDKILVNIYEDEQGKEIYIYDMKRDTSLYLLAGLFVLVVLLIGGVKGLKGLIALGITLFAILGIFLPRVLAGDSPLILASGIAVGVTIISILLIGGINKKSVASIVGTSMGVICAGLLALFFGRTAYLSGLSTADAQMLMYIPQGTNFDFTGLLFAGILLGTLGAVMDVSISIASAIQEVSEANPLLGIKELFVSGMNIGKDVMGTMTNTLILAYVGSSLHLMLLFLAYQMPYKEIVNNDLIVTEIVRSVAGTIGLILAIPITAIVAALLTKKSVNQEVYNEEEEIEAEID